MDQEDRIYASKVISIENYHGNHVNVLHSNYGNGTQPNKDFKVFKRHRVNDLLLLSMVNPIQHDRCKS